MSAFGQRNELEDLVLTKHKLRITQVEPFGYTKVIYSCLYYSKQETRGSLNTTIGAVSESRILRTLAITRSG